tara:strand:+ start:924 stop:1247 length:324 start_codon:yes stop_codon:yes gene_type:complete
MRKQYFYNILYFCILASLVVPLVLNIKINEISNQIIEVNNEILLLERERNAIKLKHSDVFSIANIDKLSKVNLYERLDVAQKINKLQIPYKLNNREKAKVAVLGFGK